AVSNLLRNAIHHGLPATPVRVVLRSEPGLAFIAVHNQGPPIPEETLPLIFDPFKRGDRLRTEGQGQGLGLGLYIVQKVVEAHGGHVEARSTRGEGTTFTLVLPR
ncbi:MAG TPA: sensor histidine kinase, partial [Myxococcales bacterium]